MDIDLIDENILFVSMIIIADIYLGLWVYLANRKSEVNRQFAGLTLLLLFWAVFCYAKSILPVDISLILVKSAYAIVALFFTLFYFFLNNFPVKGQTNRFLDGVIMFTGAVLVVFPFAGPMVDNIISVRGKNIPELGEGRFFYLGLISLLILFISARFYRKYLGFSKEEKLKAEYFFTGFIVFIVINFVFNIIIPLWQGNAQYSCLGNHSAILFLILTAYAIVKHDLLGIKPLFTQILVGVISFILLADVLFLSNDIWMQLLKIGTLMIFLYFGRELIKSVRKEKEAREKMQKANLSFEERNRDFHILLEASSRVGQDLDSKKISQDVVDSVPKSLRHLGYNIGMIVLYSAKKDCIYAYAVTDSQLTRKVAKTTKMDARKFREYMSSGNDLIAKTIRNKKVYVSDKMEDFFGSFMDREKNKEVQKLMKAKSFISLPLFSSGRAIGAIILASQKKPEHITEKNKNIVWAFASHIGSAIENAQLYEKTNRQMGELGALNRSLRKANIQLKELLEMKNEFLHITSHQLRTPLTSIRGMISMWIDGDFEKLPKKQKEEMLRRIYISTERLNNITNDMLDALELEGGVMKMEFKKVSVVEIMKDTIATLQSDYDKKGLYLRMGEVGDDIPDIDAEPNYIAQIFMNIIDNSCKYTQTGGTRIDVKREGKNVVVYIKDTGIGMDGKEIKRAFDKFTRGKNAMKENASGSGLGLFIAKKVLEEHNGKISIKSDGAGKGTMFKISLPIRQ